VTIVCIWKTTPIVISLPENSKTYLNIMSQFKARFHQNYNYLQNNRWKNIIKKHIVGDFYFLNHSIENIITDRFTDEIITPNKKILVIIPPINPLVIIRYYRLNKLIVNPSVIICILLIEFVHRRITSNSGKSCKFFSTL